MHVPVSVHVSVIMCIHVWIHVCVRSSAHSCQCVVVGRDVVAAFLLLLL